MQKKLLKNLQKISYFMEIGHQEPCQEDPRPPSWSWSQEWQMGLAMVRIHQKCNGDANFHISWRLDIRNPVKKTPILHLGVGVKSDRGLLRWSGSIRNVMHMLGFKFHADWTSGTPPRWPLSPYWSWGGHISGTWSCRPQVWHIKCTLRNLIQMTPVLHPGFWWVLRWSGSIRNVMEMLSFKFHRDWTSGTLSRRTLSSILKLESRITDGSWDG